MTPKHWIGLVIMLGIMMPSIGLIEGALRNTKEEQREIVKLKFNRTFLTFQIVNLLMALGIGLAFTLLPFLLK